MNPSERFNLKKKLDETKAGFNQTKEEIQSLLNGEITRGSRTPVVFFTDARLRMLVQEKFIEKGIECAVPLDVEDIQRILNTRGNSFPFLVDLDGYKQAKEIHHFRRPFVVLAEGYNEDAAKELDNQGVPWIVPPMDFKVITDVLRIR